MLSLSETQAGKRPARRNDQNFPAITAARIYIEDNFWAQQSMDRIYCVPVYDNFCSQDYLRKSQGKEDSIFFPCSGIYVFKLHDH